MVYFSRGENIEIHIDASSFTDTSKWMLSPNHSLSDITIMNTIPKPFDMKEYIKHIDGVGEWIASLPLSDENYTLDFEMRSMPTFGNPYALQCSMTPECKVTLKRYAGGLEEIYTSTFINGQQCANTYTATLVGESYGPVIGGDGPELVTLPKGSSVYPAEQLKELGIEPAKNELEKFHDDLLEAMQPKEEIVTQDEDDEDYYDSVWR